MGSTILRATACALLLHFSAGCSSSTSTVPPFPPGSAAKARAFEDAVRTFAEADAAGRWDEATCEAVREGFEPFLADAEAGPEAQFNAALTASRCGDDEGARAVLRAALEHDPRFARARWLLASLEPTLTPDERVRELQRASDDASSNDPTLLLALGRAQMARRSDAPDDDGPSDLERAMKNFRRALAVDDGFAPAVSELALAQLIAARRDRATAALTREPGARRKVDVQALELVHLVVSQGLRRHPSHAPLHNTLGLVLFELGDASGAVAAFDAARKLDPGFLDAHLNAAAVNLGFRGFSRAEDAFRRALAVREDYDTLLGLSLAIRGQADADAGEGSNARLAEASSILERAKKLAPARPEAHFNHAVLLEIYGDRADGVVGTTKAISQYERFVELAKDDPRFAEDVRAVTAVPSKDDAACMGEAARTDPACTRGRLYDLRQLLDAAPSEGGS